MKKVLIESERLVFEDFFKIQEAWLSYEKTDGTMSPRVRRLSFERGDSVAALLFDRDSRSILLVRQFRYPTHRKGPGWILETVAGIVEEGESPEDSMRREILEETGYRATDLEHVANFYVSPGGSSERIGLYYAAVGESDRVGPGRGDPTEDEDVETVAIPVEELHQILESGEIVDAKTLIALFWWLGRGHEA